MDINFGEWLAAVERTELFSWVRETWAAIPPGWRVAILVTVAVTALVTKWVIPALVPLIRATRDGKEE